MHILVQFIKAPFQYTTPDIDDLVPELEYRVLDYGPPHHQCAIIDAHTKASRLSFLSGMFPLYTAKMHNTDFLAPRNIWFIQ